MRTSLGQFAVVSLAVVGLTLSCSHPKPVVAPPVPTAAPTTAPTEPSPAPSATEITSEPAMTPAEVPESEVSSTALPEDIAAINRAGFLKDAFFDTDKADLTADARTILAADADWLKAHPSIRITVEGHCDERNTEEYNLALGWRRANGVKDYLVALGVEPARIGTISYGEERPFATCHDESCWSQNRRAHLVVIAK